MTVVRLRRAVLALPLVVAAACSAPPGPAPSLLDPQGERAARIAGLGWFMIALATVIFVIVAVALSVALFRKRGPVGGQGPVGTLGPADLRGAPDAARWVVALGIVAPALVLALLMGLSIRQMTVLTAPAHAASLTIEVVGHRFWWEARYPDFKITTANEIHIPTGEPVALHLSSEDVIHSFWVPQLQGKMDMIPGKLNQFWLQADRPGTYRGQCAEFCGIQHAHMGLLVIAEDDATFHSWLTAQQQPAAQSSDSMVQRGAQVFARSGCISCHAIRAGRTPVGGSVGPDLTHLASRQTIAAGTLANTRGALGGWIENSQAIKPGNPMPAQSVNGEDLQALLDYLQSLK